MSRKFQSKCKNLRPMVEYLKTIHPEGLSLSVIAGEVGMSPQRLSSILMTDNAHLSVVERIYRNYGHELHLVYSFRGEYPTSGTITLPPNSGNLSGLAEYGIRMNRTVNAMATLAGVKRDTLARAISTGDIMIATLNRVADKLGLVVNWQIISL